MGIIGNKTLLGVFWSMFSRFGTLLIAFVSNLILVRILSPTDFGCIGMLMIFITLSNTILDGGLGAALIQKKDPDSTDYSTVFTYNILISVLLYTILYLTAPSIAEFYRIELLSDVLRVQGLILFINAFRIIQYNFLIKNLYFKELAIYEIIASVTGTSIGIIMAYSGFGVWSLVFSNLLYSLMFTFILNIRTKWKPRFVFNRQAFISLFSFGGMILLSNIIDAIYKNIQSLVIGRVFESSKLGYYSQAEKLESIPVNGLSSAVNGVFFPIFSQLQDDKKKLGVTLLRNINVLSYLSFPIMVMAIIVATPLLDLLYTSKWHESIPYFQILCFSGMILPINMSNINIIRSLGKGHMYFYMQIYQVILGIAAICFGIRWGIFGMLIATVVSAYIFYITTVIINSRLLGIGILTQLSMISGNLSVSFLIGLVVHFLTPYIAVPQRVLNILIPVFVYILLYIICSHILKLSGYYICLNLLRK